MSSMNPHLGLPNPFDRTSHLFAPGSQQAAAAAAAAAAASSTSSSTIVSPFLATSTAAIDPKAHLDFYSQRLKQLAGSTSPDAAAAAAAAAALQAASGKQRAAATTPHAFPSPSSSGGSASGGGPNSAEKSRSEAGTPHRPGMPITPTDSAKSMENGLLGPRPSPSDDKENKSNGDSSAAAPDSSEVVRRTPNGATEASDKHSSGSVDEDLLEEDGGEEDEAEDLTTKSVSTPASTPASTPVPSSSSENAKAATPVVGGAGSVIGDLMSKFGFSDIQVR